jgi:hypothetical protein
MTVYELIQKLSQLPPDMEVKCAVIPYSWNSPKVPGNLRPSNVNRWGVKPPFYAMLTLEREAASDGR